VREELRLRHRYLDLRRERQWARKLAAAAQARNPAARTFLEGEGFNRGGNSDPQPAIHPRGAREYLVPSRVCGGRVFALPQSPTVQGKLLMWADCERYLHQVARLLPRREPAAADPAAGVSPSSTRG